MTIVSFEYGYLFVKTRKVGGTSVEAVLRSFTGERDIVTALTPADEFYCAQRGLDAKNYARRAADERRYREQVLTGRFDAARRDLRRMSKRVNTHMTAAQLRRRLGRKTFSRLYRFSIERNPFSWLVSLVTFDSHAYNAQSLVTMDIDTIRERISALLSRRNPLKSSNYPYYTIHGKPAVDRVLRFEHLEEDLRDLLQHLEIADEVTLPMLKRNPPSIPLSEIYTPELETEVLRRFQPVFQFMGYPRRIC